jgi:hypothetical protein
MSTKADQVHIPRCTNVTLYQSDFFDESFTDRYKGKSWPRENTFRVEAASSHRPTSRDKLEIISESTDVIPCVKINLVDLFLIVDFAPGEKLSFEIPRQRGGIWFAADVLQGGEILRSGQAGFDRDDLPDVTLSLTVRVRSDQILLGLPKGHQASINIRTPEHTKANRRIRGH